MLKGVNWIAVLVAVVLLEGLGFLWYGPLFGAAWMAALPYKPDMTNASTLLAVGVVNTVVVTVGLAWLIARLGATSLTAAVGICLAAWLFFDFTTQALEYLYMGLPAQLVAINMGFQLASYLITGVVLALVKFGRPAAAATA
jgi:hypothetical protein